MNKSVFAILRNAKLSVDSAVLHSVQQPLPKPFMKPDEMTEAVSDPSSIPPFLPPLVAPIKKAEPEMLRIESYRVEERIEQVEKIVEIEEKREQEIQTKLEEVQAEPEKKQEEPKKINKVKLCFTIVAVVYNLYIAGCFVYLNLNALQDELNADNFSELASKFFIIAVPAFYLIGLLLYVIPADFSRKGFKIAFSVLTVFSGLAFLAFIGLYTSSSGELEYQCALISGTLFLTLVQWLGLRVIAFYSPTLTGSACVLSLAVVLPICYWYIWHVLIYEYNAFLRLDEDFHQFIHYLTYSHILVFFGYSLTAGMWMFCMKDKKWIESKKREYMIKVQYLHLMEGIEKEKAANFARDVENVNTPCFQLQFKVSTYLFGFFYIIVTFALEVYGVRNYLKYTYLQPEEKRTEGNSAYSIISATFAFISLVGIPFTSILQVPYGIKQLFLSFAAAFIFLLENAFRSKIVPATQTYLDTVVPTGTICLLVLSFVYEFERAFYKWAFVLIYLFFWLPLYVLYPLMNSGEISGYNDYVNLVYYSVIVVCGIIVAAMLGLYISKRRMGRLWIQCDFQAVGQLLNSICYVVATMGLLYAFYKEEIDTDSIASDIAIGFAGMLQIVYFLFTVLMAEPNNSYEVSHSFYPQAGLEVPATKSALDRYVSLIVSGILLWVCIPLIILCKSLYSSSKYTTGITAGCVGFLVWGSIYLALNEMKAKLGGYRKTILPLICFGFWLFLILPLMFGYPLITIKWMDEANQEELFNYMSCFAFFTIFITLFLLCIGITIAAKGIRKEAEVCNLFNKLQGSLAQNHIFCADYHIRMLVEQFLAHDPEILQRILEKHNYVYWWAIPEDLQDQYGSKIMIITRHLYSKLIARLQLTTDPQKIEELKKFQEDLTKLLEAEEEESKDMESVEDLTLKQQKAVKEKVEWEAYQQKMESLAIDFSLLNQCLATEQICPYKQLTINEMKLMDSMAFNDTVSGTGIKNQLQLEEYYENPSALLKEVFYIFSSGEPAFINSEGFARMRSYVGINEGVPLSTLDTIDGLLMKNQRICFDEFEVTMQQLAQILYPEQNDPMKVLIKEKLYRSIKLARKEHDFAKNKDSENNQYGCVTVLIFWNLVIQKLCGAVGNITKELSQFEYTLNESDHLEFEEKVDPYDWENVTQGIVSTLQKSQQKGNVVQKQVSVSSLEIYVILAFMVLEFYYFLLPSLRPELSWNLSFIQQVLLAICFEPSSSVTVLYGATGLSVILMILFSCIYRNKPSQWVVFLASTLLVPIAKTVFDLLSYKYTYQGTYLYRSNDDYEFSLIHVLIVCLGLLFFFYFFIKSAVWLPVLQNSHPVFGTNPIYYGGLLLDKIASAGVMSFCKESVSLITGFTVLAAIHSTLTVFCAIAAPIPNLRLKVIHMCEFSTLGLCAVITIIKVLVEDAQVLLFGILGIVLVGAATIIFAIYMIRKKENKKAKVHDGNKDTEEEMKRRASDSERIGFKVETRNDAASKITFIS